MEYSSTNYQKHVQSKGLKKHCINRFNHIILNDLQPMKNKTIVDAGCGEGFFIKQLVNNNFQHIHGFDLSLPALSMAQQITKLPPDHFWQDNVTKLSHPHKYDVVLCLEVLEHIKNPEIALSQISLLTKNLLYVSVPKEPYFCLGNFLTGKNISRLGNAPDHHNLWTTTQFKRFVEKNLGNAFSISRLEPSIFPWTILKCVKH